MDTIKKVKSVLLIGALALVGCNKGGSDSAKTSSTGSSGSATISSVSTSVAPTSVTEEVGKAKLDALITPAVIAAAKTYITSAHMYGEIETTTGGTTQSYHVGADFVIGTDLFYHQYTDFVGSNDSESEGQDQYYYKDNGKYYEVEKSGTEISKKEKTEEYIREYIEGLRDGQFIAGATINYLLEQPEITISYQTRGTNLIVTAIEDDGENGSILEIDSRGLIVYVQQTYTLTQTNGDEEIINKIINTVTYTVTYNSTVSTTVPDDVKSAEVTPEAEPDPNK